MILFRILWTVDALVSLVFLYFFFVGLADGTVSSRNIGLWMIILVALAGILTGSVYLRNHEHITISFLLLWILAIPALLFGVYILIAMFGNQRWN